MSARATLLLAAVTCATCGTTVAAGQLAGEVETELLCLPCLRVELVLLADAAIDLEVVEQAAAARRRTS